MAPPLTLTSRVSAVLVTAQAWAANASLASTRSRSECSSRLLQGRREGGLAPTLIAGSTPAFARDDGGDGSMPPLGVSADISTTAAPPSLMPDRCGRHRPSLSRRAKLPTLSAWGRVGCFVSVRRVALRVFTVTARLRPLKRPSSGRPSPCSLRDGELVLLPRVIATALRRLAVSHVVAVEVVNLLQHGGDHACRPSSRRPEERRVRRHRHGFLAALDDDFARRSGSAHAIATAESPSRTAGSGPGAPPWARRHLAACVPGSGLAAVRILP